MSDPTTPQEMRDWIHAQYSMATTDEQRSRLLDLHRQLNDSLERQITDPKDLELLRDARRKDYALLLISEAVDQDGNVSPELIARVTEREVREGRMAEDDEMRTLGRIGERLLTNRSPVSPPALGLLKRLFGKAKKRT
ncbi:hypothetical protein RKE25_09875 [Dyella sp. BiH032]|uniref:hypothetical protein n=1 Tax=Dyella sp. BiH032 TaxID=3075430 RepID=UPI0028932BF2|nr:hypothetical protein [Dyella sp. BiH032]WNL47907.1 hypothetical protein RKE25_09875 [Dyella sp. BiH032]